MKKNRFMAMLAAVCILLTIPSYTMATQGSPYVNDEDTQPVDLLPVGSGIALQSVVVPVSSKWPSATRIITSNSQFPLTLRNNEVVLLQGTLRYDARPGASPISVEPGALAAIIIQGNVTLNGANASGTTGATAAIHVPASSSLTIYSAEDQSRSTDRDPPTYSLTVTGGSAAPGGNGGAGEKKYEPNNATSFYYHWYAGSGGNGGGGAAAAIGGNGGSGGYGGSRFICQGEKGKKTQPVQIAVTTLGTSITGNDDNPGRSGNDGTMGRSGETCGGVYIAGRLTVKATGGSAAKGGSGGAGSIGKASLGGTNDVIGGAGGGGGGGGGLAAPAIGAGGAGGSGGGSGGELGSDHRGEVQGGGGGGGGGGWPNGGGGGGGVSTSERGGDKQDALTPGSGGSGGGVGGSGSGGTGGATAYSAWVSASSGGSGAGGMNSSSGGAGGAGGKDKHDSDTSGGPGGDGGGAVNLTIWHGGNNLVLSTACNLVLKSGSASGSFLCGDGEGYSTSGRQAMEPSIIYDLMDCDIQVKEYTYTGSEIKPTLTDVTVTYSASSDRDGATVYGASGTVNVQQNATLTLTPNSSPGKNIHCPTGSLTLTGKSDSTRSSVTTNGAIVGTRAASFTINKAEMTGVSFTVQPTSLTIKPPAVSSSATLTLTDRYAFKSDTSKTGKLSELWLDANGTTGWPVNPLWQTSPSGTTISRRSSNVFTFTANNRGVTRIGVSLRGMNDFKDYDMPSAEYKSVTVMETMSLSITGSAHPHSGTLTVTGVPAAANATYKWTVGGKTVSTASSYSPTNADMGSTVWVTVTPGSGTYYSGATLRNTVGMHDYSVGDASNGFCSVCGEYMPADPVSGTANTYRIATGGQMFWFAALVNGDDTHAGDVTQSDAGASAMLLQDISLQNPHDGDTPTEWTTIGSKSSGKVGSGAFTGTFDGKEKTISDMHITKLDADQARTGLFASLTGNGCVKDFTIKGSIELSASNSEKNDSGIGGAVGYMRDGGTVTGVTSVVTITNNGGSNELVHVGGVVGGAYSNTNACKISQCVYDIDGAINVSSSHDCIGGVVGYSGCNGNSPGTATSYCANRGTVTATKARAYLGGVVGYINNDFDTVKNCYNYGRVSGASGNPNIGAIIGCLRSNTNIAARFTDCYYLSGSAARAVGTDQSSVNPSLINAPVKGTAAFKNGEVCYLVNLQNGQPITLGTDIWKQNVDKGSPYHDYPVFAAYTVYRHQDGAYSNYAENVSVTLTWNSMEFLCSESWDPATHKASYTWTPQETDSDLLLISNEGNVSVSAELSFKPLDKFSSCGLTGEFAGAPLYNGAHRVTIPRAGIEEHPANPELRGIRLGLRSGDGTGAAMQDATDMTDIGTLTVTLSPYTG